MQGLPLALACILCPAAMAAAPVEERTHRSDPLEDAQQRAEYARRQGELADAELGQAQRALRESEAALANAQKQFDEARARRDQARKQVAAAQQHAGETKKIHDREAADFDRLRRADSQRAAKK